MKKITKIASVAMAAVMMFSAVPFTTATAATTKKVVNSANVSNGIKLSWKKTSKAKKYTVYRSTSKTKGYKSLGKTKKLTFTDKKAKGGKTYYYKVKASTGASYKVEKAVRLNAPTIKSIKAYDESIKLTWSAVKGAKSYCVYRYYDGFGYMCIDEVKKTTYNDDMIYEDGTYKYKVSAVNGDSESVKSAYKKVKYTAPLDAPVGVACMNKDRTAMKIVYNQMKDAQGYRIYRSTDNGKNFDLLKDIKTADVEKADGIFAKIEKFAESLVKLVAEETDEITQNQIDATLDEIGLKFAQYVDTDVTYGGKYTYAIEYYTAKQTSPRQTIGANIEFKEADLEMTVGEESDYLNKPFELTDEMKAMLKEYELEDIDDKMINSIISIFKDLFDISYEVEDSEIVTVDENDNIKALKVGKTTIKQTISLDIEGLVISFSSNIVVKVNEGETEPSETPSEPTQDPSENPSEPSSENSSETPSDETQEPSETPSVNPSEGTQEPSETPSENPSEGTQEPSENSSEATSATTTAPSTVIICGPEDFS